MEKISLLLIRALSEQDGFMTTKEIAAKVGVSTKTVRRYVEKINQSQSLYGCVIQGKKGSGLFLQIINHELFQRSLENTPQEDFVTQIIEYFVQEDEYIKSELLCERLFISQSKLSQELKKLRRILSHYNLSIQTKPYYGMKLINEGEKDGKNKLIVDQGSFRARRVYDNQRDRCKSRCQYENSS